MLGFHLKLIIALNLLPDNNTPYYIKHLLGLNRTAAWELHLSPLCLVVQPPETSVSA